MNQDYFITNKFVVNDLKPNEIFNNHKKLSEIDWYVILSSLETNYSEKIRYCDKIIKLYPKSTRCWIIKCNCLIKIKNYEEALQINSKLIEMQPLKYFNWHKRGKIFEEMKLYDEAIECLNKSQFIISFFKKPIILMKISKYDDSLKYINEIPEYQSVASEFKSQILRHATRVSYNNEIAYYKTQHIL
jgi:tetratricopeptide (TPR) repeat protein